MGWLWQSSRSKRGGGARVHPAKARRNRRQRHACGGVAGFGTKPLLSQDAQPWNRGQRKRVEWSFRLSYFGAAETIDSNLPISKRLPKKNRKSSGPRPTLAPNPR